MVVQEELQRTQFLVSEDSLQHSAEYHSRLEVLKELNYVDTEGTRKLCLLLYMVELLLNSLASNYFILL